MTDAVDPRDAAGAETLEIMSAAPRYNAWQYQCFAPWVGKRVLEVGSGIGNMSAHLLTAHPELVLLTDTDPWYRDQLRSKFAERAEVVVEELTLPDSNAVQRLCGHALDTVVALNVVEHIGDDVGALRTMASLVGQGGRVIVLVPALQILYGTLDRELGHFRRYSRKTLTRAFGAAGMRIERMFWFNRVGMAGWWYNARIRKASRLPIAQLRFFDSLVPVLRQERHLPLPFGQSLIAIGTPT